MSTHGMPTARLLILSLAWLIAAPVGAQDAAETKPWTFDGFVGFEYQSETDLDPSANGDFEYYMPNFGFKGTYKADESWTAILAADHRVISYDFDVPGGNEPWETIHVFRVNPSLRYNFTEHLLVQFGPIFEFAGETDSERDKAVRGGGQAFIGYVSENFGVGLGVLVTSDIEDDAWVQPAGFLDWNITDNLSLNSRFESSRGGELNLGYLFFDRVRLSAGYGYRRERFRLNDDGIPQPGREDGVGEETAQVVKITGSWLFTDRLSLDLYWGTTLDGEFKLDDEDGSQIAQSDYDDSSFAGVMFHFGW